MYNRLAYFVFLQIGFTLPLIAWTEPQPGCFAIQGDLLYLSPSYDETYFVIDGSGRDGMGNPTPHGKRNNNPVGYNFGFRLEGIYEFCDSCFDVRLRWTHLYATSTTTVSNLDVTPQLWPIEIIPNQPNVPEPFSGTASSHIGIMHQKGECLFDEKAWDLYCCRFFLREGLEWSYIRYHEVIEYKAIAGSQEKIQLHGHTKGIGPQLGIIALCEPWTIFEWYPRNLSFKFMTTASLILANSKAKVRTTDILAANNKITQSSFWKLVPEWALGFGINYSNCFWSHPASIEIGYEMTTYFRGISKLIFVDSAHPGVSFNQYSDFYVHGIYLALSTFF